jgi:hypothetical protein
LPSTSLSIRQLNHCFSTAFERLGRLVTSRDSYLSLITFQLLEWLNPGYLRRYEQKQKRERGIEYWMRPSAAA